MAEILVKFDEPIAAPGGKTYLAHAVGKEVDGGLWDGWLEFQGVDDGSEVLASGRETTQPNRRNVEYWAQGLTKVYLEGALARAISLAEPSLERVPTKPEPAWFSEPASRSPNTFPPRPLSRRAILDPFQVYSQGEQILLGELRALSRDHLENIAPRMGRRPQSGASRSIEKDLIEAIVGVPSSSPPARDSARRAEL